MAFYRVQRSLSYLCCLGAAAAGRNAYFVTVAWIVVDASRNPGLLALLLAAGSAAEILTTNFGGSIADRFDRRLICLICDALRSAIIAATIFGVAHANPIYVVALSWVTFCVIDRTHQTSMQAMLPCMIEGGQGLMAFNSISNIAMQAGNLLAVLATGAVIVATPQQYGLTVSLLCFALSFLAMAANHHRPARSLETLGHSRVRMVDVLPTTLPSGRLMESVAVYALIYAMGMLANVLAAALAIQQLDGTALQFSYLEAGWAAGSVGGCVLLIFFAPRRRLTLPLLLSGFVLLSFFMVQDLTASIVQMTILGITYNVARIVIDVQAQKAVGSDKLGRARSQIQTLCTCAGLVVYGLVALIGSTLQPSIVFGSFGIVMMAAAILTIYRNSLRRAVATWRPRPSR